MTTTTTVDLIEDRFSMVRGDLLRLMVDPRWRRSSYEDGLFREYVTTAPMTEVIRWAETVERNESYL